MEFADRHIGPRRWFLGSVLLVLGETMTMRRRGGFWRRPFLTVLAVGILRSAVIVVAVVMSGGVIAVALDPLVVKLGRTKNTFQRRTSVILGFCGRFLQRDLFSGFMFRSGHLGLAWLGLASLNTYFYFAS